MEINIRLDTADHKDLQALTALVAALGGRLPETTAFAAERVTAAPAAQGVQGESDGSGEPDGTAGTAPTTANESDRDASGLPWDERIHSGNREKNAGDGLWRKRRGVAQELVDSVTAELRGATDPTPPASPEPSAPPPPPPPAPVDTAPASSAATSAAEPAAPPPPPPSPAATGGARFKLFPELIHAVQAKDVPDDKKVYAALTPIAQLLGVSSFPLMKDHPELWDDFYEMVGTV